MKERQRLFYARVLDYMDAERNAVLVKYEKAFEILSANNWLCGDGDSEPKTRNLLRKDWHKKKLNQIHILRGESNLLYNQTTVELTKKLRVRINSISNKTVDFLEQLFGEIRDNLNVTRRWKHVARDRKLLYRPFDNCHNLESAIDGYYSRHGGGGRLPGKIRDRKKQPNGEYNNRIGECDSEIKKSLLNMTAVTVSDLAFQPSLLISEVHKPQEAHIDYDTSMKYDQKYLIAFLPLTETGQFLQIWERSVNGEPIHGKVIFIPRGQLVLVPGDTIHGGGFRADIRSDDIHAHMRLHFYVYPGEITSQIDRHKNEYMDPTIYLQNAELMDSRQSLQNNFFDA